MAARRNRGHDHAPGMDANRRQHACIEHVDVLAVTGPNQRIDRTIRPDAARALRNELGQRGWYRATKAEINHHQMSHRRLRAMLTDDPGRVAWRGDRSGRKEPKLLHPKPFSLGSRLVPQFDGRSVSEIRPSFINDPIHRRERAQEARG